MKKIFLILSVLSYFVFAGCSDGSSSNDNSFTFKNGWYKYNDGTTTAYILYNKYGEVKDAISSTAAYTSSQLEIAKTAYSGEREEVTSCLTRLKDQYYELPSFYRAEAIGPSLIYKCFGNAKEFSYGVEIYGPGDGFTVTCGVYSKKLNKVIESTTNVYFTEINESDEYPIIAGTFTHDEHEVKFVMDDTVISDETLCKFSYLTNLSTNTEPYRRNIYLEPTAK
ncbi:hypothetical protein [Treponema sp.]|uniref:hypothetical protein n=1 Tax=Treponema sp. TaxID=166 RepID=UPI00257D803E|nr:hypothetical protein [Treponema sp.]MBE6353818.1 hypothetical protein [Treponema sp.]